MDTNYRDKLQENRLTQEKLQELIASGRNEFQKWMDVEEGTSPGMKRIKKGMDEYERKHPEKYR